MERLSGEARDRARAGALSVVVAITLVGVAIGLYATFVGFERTTVVTSDVVAVSEDGTRVTVRFHLGGCQEPAGVDLDEDDDAVVLTARVTERTPLQGRACQADREEAREDVTLATPLGDRELLTAQP